jgi:TolB-like protein/Flp pilus assembly protein TadD
MTRNRLWAQVYEARDIIGAGRWRGMASASRHDQAVIRFGVFELDTATGELRKRGRRVRLRPQAARVLQILAERSSEVVLRSQLKASVWGADTFVDFEHGLNLCIRQIREALNDDANTPRFIETLPRRGYRFIAPLEAGVSTASEPATIRSVAVLPFQNFGGDPADEYLADGMTEALITELAGIGALRVISRTSAMQYKSARKPLPVIATELQVDTVIEGSVRRFGNQVRTTVQLLDAREDKHLWTANYDHDFRDILMLQRDVALAVAAQMKIKVTEQERSRRSSARPVDAGAYEAYLKGRYHVNKVTTDDLRKAVTCFKQAIEQSNDFAPAYAGLADCYISFGATPHGGERPTDVMPLAKTFALRALEVDPNLAEAHVELAMVKWRYDWDWPAAAEEFDRAIELSPGLAAARQRYGWYLWALGRHDESIAQTTRALKDDPLSVWTRATLGLAFYYARRYDGAIQQLTDTLEMDANFMAAHVFLAFAFEQKKMFAEAIREFQEALRLVAAPGTRAHLAHAYAASGNAVEARRIVGELVEMMRQRYLQAYCLVPVYAALGDIDEAFAWLARACDERDGWIVYVNVDPRLDGLRSDVRFADVLRRIGLNVRR